MPVAVRRLTLALRVGAVDQAAWWIDPQNPPPALAFGGPIEIGQVFTAAMDGSLLAVQVPVDCDYELFWDALR